MKRSKPETSVQAKIVEALRKAGYVVHRLHCGQAKAKGGVLQLEEEGTPDLLVVGAKYPNDGARVVYLEVKTKTGEPSDAQQRMHKLLRSKGATVEVVRDPIDALRVVMGPKVRKCGT